MVTVESARRPALARPRILVIGNAPRRTAPVQEALEVLRARIDCMPWVVGLLDTLDRTTLAVVMVPPLPGIQLGRAVRLFRRSPWGSNGGIFLLLHDEAPDREVRGLYRAGATAVLHWPRDSVTLPDLVAEINGIEQVRGKATDADTALGRSVRARLRLAASMPAHLRVSCREGLVRLTGSIDGLWQRPLVAELVARVPGVRGVVTEGLRVPPSGLSDAAVGRAVRRLLRTMPGVAEESLTVAVHNGVVSLAGSLTSRRELEEVLRAVSDVRGVREIDNLLVVSPGQLDDDRRVARRLQGALERLFPGREIAVKVFGGVVVLRGVVEDLVTKRRVEEVAVNDPATTRVIDKLALG
jgi:osmotically-inducible protein OsmY